MQIHHLEVKRTYENVIDPRTGKVVRRMSEPQLAPASTSGITSEDGEQFNVAPDGTFEVPHEVGAYYLKQDGWFVGSNPFAEQLLAEHEAREQAAVAEREADEARAAQEAAEKAAAEKKAKTPAKA